MELKSPKKKRSSYKPSNQGIYPSYKLVGRFTGSSVIIVSPEETQIPYAMGCFGKGSLSRGSPTYCDRRSDRPLVIEGAQFERRQQWNQMEPKQTCISSGVERMHGYRPNDFHQRNSTYGQTLEYFKLKPNNRRRNRRFRNRADTRMVGSNRMTYGVTPKYAMFNRKPALISDFLIEKDSHAVKSPKIPSDDIISKIIGGLKNIQSFDSLTELSKSLLSAQRSLNHSIIVVPDFDEETHESNYLESFNPRIESNVFPVSENVLLSLEESFFLCYTTDCLRVQNGIGRDIHVTEMWQRFRSVQSNFIESFITYNHFRRKGWIVKPGLKYGGHFLLYKDGPCSHHASCIVRIENVIPDKLRTLTWRDAINVNRVAESTSKEIIVCYVHWPQSLNFNYPSVIDKFHVSECLLRRWSAKSGKA